MKIKSMSVVLSVLIASLLSGCRTPPVDYTPQPETISSKEQAKTIISKIFQEQNRKTRDQQIVVEDNRIVFANDQTNLATKGEIVTGRAVYYNNITHLTLYKQRKGLYKVIGWSEKMKLIDVICLNESDAELFIDAFAFMQRLNTATK